MIPYAPKHTPWGPPDTIDEATPGIVFYTTPSHGGFWLDQPHNSQIPTAFRAASQFYEEDVNWTAVALTYPALFDEPDRAGAHDILKSFRHDAYAAYQATHISPLCDTRTDFLARHKTTWIGLLAQPTRHYPNHLQCLATLGGRAALAEPPRSFLVPLLDYDLRSPWGVVIDPARHTEITGATILDLDKPPT